MRVRALAFAALTIALASGAHAQRRVIVIDDWGCRGARVMPSDWVVTRNACPGDALAHACGIVTPACAAVTEVAASLDEAAIAACTPSAELVAAAGALYDAGDAASLARAYALYRLAAQLPSTRAIASFRAGRAALRLSRYADAVAAFGDVLGGGPVTTALRDQTVLFLSAGVLANYDLDDDGAPDATFPEARFTASFLPDAPWTREVAIAAVREIRMAEHEEIGTRAVAAVTTRWPDLGAVALAPAPVPTWGDGELDRSVIARVVTSDALATCMPSSATTLAVHLVIDEHGLAEASVSPAGSTATCVERVFRAAHYPVATGGSAAQDGIVSFVP